MAYDKKTTEEYLSALDGLRMQSMLSGAQGYAEGGTNLM